MIIKILASVFAIYALSMIFARYRKGETTKKELLFWGLIWAGIIVVVIVPGRTNVIARLIGMGRGFDALTFISMLAIFYTLYKFAVKLKSIEEELTQLVSAIALNSADAKEKAIPKASEDG